MLPHYSDCSPSLTLSHLHFIRIQCQLAVEGKGYTCNADFIFRPWKVYKEASKNIKNKKTTTEWINKATKHRPVLKSMTISLGMKTEVQSNMVDALWSTTHVHGLNEVELYWPSTSDDPKNAMQNRLTPHMLNLVRPLAAWVLEERFFRSGHQIKFGGWIFLDMVQV